MMFLLYVDDTSIKNNIGFQQYDMSSNLKIPLDNVYTQSQLINRTLNLQS